jgi:AcrR family transcriptional regulator
MRSARTLNSVRTAGGDKREAILRAATRVFAHNGYFNSKVADIAREAGVADGTVYLYFKSKEEILHSIFDRSVDEALDAARKQIALVADPREKLRQLARLHLERLGADRDLAVVFQVELRGSTKFMEEFSAAGFAEYLSLIRSTFEEGQRAGVFRADLNAKVVAKILFGALDEMATNWIPVEASLQTRASRRAGARYFSQRSQTVVNNVAEQVIVPRSNAPVRRPTAADEPATLVDVFTRVARKHKRPDTLNYKSGGQWVPISSDELLARAKQIAAGLYAIGVRHGDRVALLSESRAEWTLTDAGCIFAGAVDVPIYPTLTPPQVRYILNDSGASVLFLENREKLLELKEILSECAGSKPDCLLRTGRSNRRRRINARLSSNRKGRELLELEPRLVDS